MKKKEKEVDRMKNKIIPIKSYGILSAFNF